jgi:hypothetical protein
MQREDTPDGLLAKHVFMCELFTLAVENDYI